MEFLANESAHGNVGDLEKLREPLGVHVLLREWVPHDHPLHSSSRNRSLRVLDRMVLITPRFTLVFFFVVIILDLSRSVRSPSDDA